MDRYDRYTDTSMMPTERAQKQTSTKERKRQKTKTTNPVKAKHSKESYGENNVVDLNEVLHHAKKGELVDDSSDEKDSLQVVLRDEDAMMEESTSDDREIKESSVLSDAGFDSNNSDGSLEGGSEGSTDAMDVGLVGVKDEIPDEEFEKMISGELDPWGSHDQASMSHDKDDRNGTEDQSHDIKDKSHARSDHERREGINNLIALILAPTRELAIQVHDHLVAVAKHTRVKVRVRTCTLETLFTEGIC